MDCRRLPPGPPMEKASSNGEAFSICALVGVGERTGWFSCIALADVAHSTHEHSTQNGYRVPAVVQIGELSAEPLVEEFRSLDRVTGLRVLHWINWVVRFDLLHRFVSERARHHVGAHHRWSYELEARPKKTPKLLNFSA